MRKKIPQSILFFFLLFVFSCTSIRELRIQEFDKLSSQIKKAYAPDKSLAVFEARLLREKGRWLLSGETSEALAHKKVFRLADSLLGNSNYKANFRLLPESALGDSSYGIVSIPVTNLRRKPKNSAELIDQNILGNPLRLLKKKKAWYLVQTHYGYIGWMAKYSLVRTDKRGLEEWKNGARVRVSNIYAAVRKTPNPKTDVVMRLPLNCTLHLISEQAGWTEISLPDGKRGFISNADIVACQRDTVKATREAIVNTARSMMGAPYLWGGKSSLANDCSGFTQTVFKAHGIQLPRDARQQVFEGDELVPNSDFSNVKAGDLLFFGFKGRITHVGISLGGYDFIHQDSAVHIDSFDEKAPNFNAFRKKSLKSIRRIIKE